MIGHKCDFLCSKKGYFIYISADYDPEQGDRKVIDELIRWNESERHKMYFCDTARPSDSVSDSGICYPCDLKAEFNKQINA